MSSLSQSLADFRAALASKNLAELSSAQLALLDAADKAEQSLKDDKSPQADLVRAAIDDLRTGASGQTRLLDSAARALSQAGGRGTGQSGTPTAGDGSAGVDLATATSSLRESLAGYEQARRERNPENLLRRQKDLVDALAQVQAATKDQSSEEARALRSAAESLRRSLEGSPEDLGDALAQARTAIGAVSPAQEGDRPNPAAALEPVQRKAAEFRAALSSGDRGELARLQRDLLDEVSRAEASLRGDSSTAAGRARTALAGIRDGASGDTAKLDNALAGLQQATGSAGDSSSGVRAGSPTNVRKTAEELQGKVAALRDAVEKGNTGDQLRLQRELYELTAQAKPGLEGDQSKQAGALRAALDAVNNGLSGDDGKLVEAERQLDQALGKPQSAGRTPTPGAQVDLGPLRGTLENRLSALEDALQREDEAAIEKAQEDLRAAAKRAADALPQSQSAETSRLRAVITAAGEAASGDLEKVKAAKQKLHEATQ